MWNFLKKALPVAAGILGSPALGAAVGAGLSFIDSRRQAGAAERAAAQAGQTAQGGYNYLAGSPVATAAGIGDQAMQAEAALLGIGGDPAAQEAAYQNFLNSTGYQAQLKSGTDAITSNAAAAGALGSGSTLRALTRYGQDLGAQSFTNYLSRVSGLAGRGVQAAGMIGSAAQAGANQSAQYQYSGAQQANQARTDGWGSLMSGAGQLWEMLRNRQQPASAAGTPAPAASFNFFRGYA